MLLTCLMGIRLQESDGVLPGDVSRQNGLSSLQIVELCFRCTCRSACFTALQIFQTGWSPGRMLDMVKHQKDRRSWAFSLPKIAQGR